MILESNVSSIRKKYEDVQYRGYCWYLESCAIDKNNDFKKAITNAKEGNESYLRLFLRAQASGRGFEYDDAYALRNHLEFIYIESKVSSLEWHIQSPNYQYGPKQLENDLLKRVTFQQRRGDKVTPNQSLINKWADAHKTHHYHTAIVAMDEHRKEDVKVHLRTASVFGRYIHKPFSTIDLIDFELNGIDTDDFID